ncbi:uncharacterized protein LOC8286255 isoform X2 [Ricinus communis]|uniref:uncharacterized protein LOC8286255 isoform X2 n=1 Tax=Ricinus communis TaxID=3988 RepID=UPI00201B2BA9|nr:uncharacterized protein LOC8286255 isoform X2 [Ricinus communis]
MESKKRWSVTYTKHMKQKRKVYQDGFLDHHIATNKVKLFDDCEKLLECKILKGEEVVSSDQTLTFSGYLVDIGDPEGEVYFDNKSLHSIDKKTDERPRPNFIHRRKFRSPSISSSDKNDALVNNLSPSKKIIREFKKSELQRYGAFQSCPDTVKPGFTEWRVMYTTQITQKAKKYHDGFLRLTSSGSFGRQIMLYDERREVLDSRFLTKDEVLRSHESITFNAHLVDIGEPEGETQISGDLNIQGNTANVVGKKGIKHEHRNYLEANSSVAKEWHTLYTSQITQKAKKFHNGILRLTTSGSCRMQVTLLNEDKTILSSKFLNLSEDVRSGSTFVLLKYLVEVGEPHSPRETANIAYSSKDAGSNFNISNVAYSSFANSIFEKIQNIAHSGKYEDSSSIYTGNLTKTSKIAATNKSLRDIHHILSILQKPVAHGRVAMECTDKNMTAPVSSAEGLQNPDTKIHNPEDCQAPLLDDGPSEHKDNRGSSESAGIEKYYNPTPNEEIATTGGGKLFCDSQIGTSDQSHPHNAEADIKQRDEAFASGFSSLAHEHKKRTEQLKSAREIHEWPTFDLGF